MPRERCGFLFAEPATPRTATLGPGGLAFESFESRNPRGRALALARVGKGFGCLQSLPAPCVRYGAANCRRVISHAPG